MRTEKTDSSIAPFVEHLLLNLKEKAPPGEGEAEGNKDENNNNLSASIQPGKGVRAPQIEAPDTLRNLPGWLLWKFEQHAGEPKPRKVPYYVNGKRRHGIQGRPEDRKQLTTFEVARAAAVARGYDGVGFAPLSDFDRCVSGGVLDQGVEALVSCTYAEFSPSGNGVRAFFLGDVGNGKAHDGPYGFETFSSKGFVTFTGNTLDVSTLLGTENTVADLTEEVKTLCVERFGNRSAAAGEVDDPLMTYEPVVGLTTQQLADALDAFPDDLPYESNTGPSWLSVGMAIHHETDGSDEGFDIWDAWSRRSPKYTTEEYGRLKWNSFGKAGARPTTARSLIHWAREHGADIDTSFVSDAAKFVFIQAAQFASSASPRWIVRNVLPMAEVVVIYGESGSGKSFFVLDMIFAIARGIEWRGFKTQQGAVAYVAAEGAMGFRKRLNAYAEHHGVDLSSLPLQVLPAAPNLLTDDDKHLARAIEAAGGASVVVVDTLAQTTPGGNENAGEDMGKVLAHCKRLHASTGALVVLIHHSGKDASKGARGWSGLRAAADAEIEISRVGGSRVAKVTKQKDGDDGALYAFTLDVVNLGLDEEGGEITSCVVKHSDAPLESAARKPEGRWENAVLDAVNDLAGIVDGPISVDSVVHQVKQQIPYVPNPEGKNPRDRRAEYTTRAVRSLAESAFFSIVEGQIVMPHAAQMPHEVT